jgi:hypothetical protein
MSINIQVSDQYQGVIEPAGNPQNDGILLPGESSGVSNSEVLIPFGDSLTATFWRQATVNAPITMSGGIATMQVNVNPAVPIGSRFRLILCNFAGYNGVHTVVATPAINQVSFVAPAGAPISETNTVQTAYFEHDQNFAANYVHYLKIFSKQRFSTPWNGGVGADDAGEALLRVDADLINQKPGRALILLGTNNALMTSPDLNQYIADMDAIFTKCLNAGIAVDACTIPPFGTGNADVSNTTKVGFIMSANKWLRDYVRVTPGMRLHDVYQWVTDPAQANGQARANYLAADGIHFIENGAYVVGKNMAANYASWLGDHPDKLPASQADGWTFNTASKNKFANHLVQGAGPIATGFSTLYTGTSNTKVDTTVARTALKDGDVFGQNQRSALNSSVAGSAGTYLFYPTDDAAIAARMTPGKTYIARGSVTLTKGALTKLTAEISIGFTVGGIARTIRAGLADIFDASGTFHIETAPFVWPAGASSRLFYFRATTTGSASDAVVEWGRIELEEVA